MDQIAWRFRDLPVKRFAPGRMVLSEGGTDGRLYVLVTGAVAVTRGGVQVALIDSPGALFGEMSVLRGVAHSASVKAVTDCDFYVIDNARAWLEERPDVALYVANLLAERLATTTALLVEAQAADDPKGPAEAGLFGRLMGALAGTRSVIALDPAPTAGARFVHE